MKRTIYRLHAPNKFLIFVKKVPGWARITILVVLIFSAFVVVYTGIVHADTAGPKDPGTAGDNTPITLTGTGWGGTANNALTSNNSYAATALASQAVSQYLNLTNFGFTTGDVPTGSTINGIKASIERNGTVVTNRCHIEDNSIKIVKGGSITGSTEMAGTGTGGAQWSTSPTDRTDDYGGTSSLWGQTWAVSDITASNFGIVISAKNIKDGGPGNTCTANVDDVKITVYYTPPPTAYDQAAYRLFTNSDATVVPTFAKSWGGASAGESLGSGHSVVQNPDGSYVVAGGTSSFGTSGDAFIAEYSAAGVRVWDKNWGGSGSDSANALVRTSDGGYAITGSTTSFGAGSTNMFIAKYTSDGNLSWDQVWGTSGAVTFGLGITETYDQGFAITGQTTGFSVASTAVFVAKFDSAGTLKWDTLWDGSSGEEGLSIIQASNRDLIIVGDSSSNFSSGSADMILIRLDSAGTAQWDRIWGGSGGSEVGKDVTELSNGYLVVTGATSGSGFGAGGQDMFAVKYNSSGTFQDDFTYGGTGSDGGTSVDSTSDGGVVVTGSSALPGFSATDAYMAKFTSTFGTLDWDVGLGGTSADNGMSVLQTSDGGYVDTGYTQSSGLTSGSNDVFIAKYDASGNITNCGGTCTSSFSASINTLIASTGTPGVTLSNPSASLTDPSPTTGTPVGTTTNIATIDPNMDVGSALASTNTSATLTTNDGQPFRLRVAVGITGTALAANGSALLLEYALRSGTCDSAGSGEIYALVTDTSPIRYYDNPYAVNGLTAATNANDPTSGSTTNRETYQEKYYPGGFTNPVAVAVGESGLWDFALTTNHVIGGDHYCFRIVKTSADLDTYTNTPEIIIPSTTYTQSSNRVFSPSSSVPTFAREINTNTFDVNDSQANDIIALSGGGYVIAGTNTQTIISCSPACVSDTSNFAFIAKYTSTGTLSWETEYGSGTEVGNAVVEVSGGYVIVGESPTYGAGQEDAFVAKFDTSGALVWDKAWGTDTGFENAHDIIVNTDGDLVITGDTSYSSWIAGAQDMFITKLSGSDGSQIWTKLWGGTDYETGNSLIQTSDGGYAVAGSTSSFGVANGTYDAFLAKYTSSGTLSWSKTWGGGAGDYALSVVQTPDSGYAVAGYTRSFGIGNGYEAANVNGLIIKYDSSGNVSWNRTLGPADASSVSFYAVTNASEGGYTVVGSRNTNSDIYLVHYDTSGSVVWERFIGTGPGLDVGYAIVQATDGGYAIGGKIDDELAGLVKTDTAGGMNSCGSDCAIPWQDTATTPSGVNLYTSSPSPTTSSQTGTSTDISGTPTNSLMVDGAAITLAYSSSVSSALVAQNRPYDATRNTSGFRLRVDVTIGGGGLAVSGQTFKLRYAVRDSDGVCDNDETYSDVGTTTPIYYYDDSNNTDEDGVGGTVNDPTDGTNLISPQTYQEANNFSNDRMPLYYGQTGEWEFSLAVKSDTQPGNDYCFKAVKTTPSDPTDLDTYSQMPDIIYGPSMPELLRQGAWWNRNGVRQNFFL